MGVDDAGDAHPAAGDLLEHEAVGCRQAAPAVLARGSRSRNAELAQALDDRLGIFVGGVERLRDGMISRSTNARSSVSASRALASRPS